MVVFLWIHLLSVQLIWIIQLLLFSIGESIIRTSANWWIFLHLGILMD